MDQKKIGIMLRVILACAAAFGIVSCAWVIPEIGRALIQLEPSVTNYYRPWLLFAWAFAVPCFAALAIAWRVASDIGADRSFTRINARRIGRIAFLAFFDTALFFAGNLILALMNMHQPGVFVLSLVCDCVGIAVGLMFWALSKLVERAAELQEESDLTI